MFRVLFQIPKPKIDELMVSGAYVCAFVELHTTVHGPDRMNETTISQSCEVLVARVVQNFMTPMSG